MDEILTYLASIAEELVTLAAAAERIAAALEADDPDAYEYKRTATDSEVDAYRAEGFKIAAMDYQGWFIMRRPRQEAPEPDEEIYIEPLDVLGMTAHDGAPF